MCAEQAALIAPIRRGYRAQAQQEGRLTCPHAGPSPAGAHLLPGPGSRRAGLRPQIPLCPLLRAPLQVPEPGGLASGWAESNRSDRGWCTMAPFAMLTRSRGHVHLQAGLCYPRLLPEEEAQGTRDTLSAFPVGRWPGHPEPEALPPWWLSLFPSLALPGSR